MQLTMPSMFTRITHPSVKATLGAIAFALALGNLGPAPLVAQSLFAPAITVNDDVITNFELTQRIQFLTLLRAPGNPEELAREALIDERLRLRAMIDADVTVTDEQIREGIGELAQRTQMSAVQFITALGESGVAPETVRDFVRVNLGWREYIRRRFLSQARPTRAEIDRAIGQDLSGGGLRVLLSEVIVPFTPETLAEAEDLTKQISEIPTAQGFASAARRFSTSASSTNGGDLDWIPITSLPAPLRGVILELNPGEISAPIPLSSAIAVFRMRGLEETSVREPQLSSIEYATFLIPGGRSAESLAQAAQLSAQVDRCDDLYGIAQSQPEGVLERQSLAPGSIPRDISLELAKLDEGEVSTSLTRNNGQTLLFLMLCGRTAALNASVEREDVAAALTQRKLTALAESFLDQLRADALIVEK